jgi:hypothetical protein
MRRDVESGPTRDFDIDWDELGFRNPRSVARDQADPLAQLGEPASQVDDGALGTAVAVNRQPVIKVKGDVHRGGNLVIFRLR